METYEEKYKKALEKAKSMMTLPTDKAMIEEIFPELKESEGERIRKELIEFVKSRGGFKQEYIAWLEKKAEQKPAGWSEEDEAIYYGVIETEQYMLDVVNGIKEFSVGSISIKEECTRELNWLKSLKDRVQPKQEWSEEDKETINNLIDYLENEDDSSYTDLDKESFAKEIKLLKSLRLQNRWKPSEEQMDILCKVSTYGVLGSSVRDVLQSLYNDLKKL